MNIDIMNMEDSQIMNIEAFPTIALLLAPPEDAASAIEAAKGRKKIAAPRRAAAASRDVAGRDHRGLQRGRKSHCVALSLRYLRPSPRRQTVLNRGAINDRPDTTGSTAARSPLSLSPPPT